MSKPIIRIHDINTNEVIDREMTEIEYKEYQLEKKAEQAKQIEIEEKELQRQTILNRLGLTADELAVLFG